MILDAASRAIAQILSAPFRMILLKTLALTLGMLVALWLGLWWLFDTAVMPWLGSLLPGLPGWVAWFGTFAGIAAGLGLAALVALMIAPATALVASLFLDDAAALVEARDYPADAPGVALPPMTSLVLSLKFFVVVVIGNIVALLLLLVPGVNILAFFVVNAYLLGREFFEFAAMRLRPQADARVMRRRHSGTVFGAGLLIAAFMSVPLVNLATPLFACALMVHLHKALSAREGQSVVGAAARR